METDGAGNHVSYVFGIEIQRFNGESRAIGPIAPDAGSPEPHPARRVASRTAVPQLALATGATSGVMRRMATRRFSRSGDWVFTLR